MKQYFANIAAIVPQVPSKPVVRLNIRTTSGIGAQNAKSNANRGSNSFSTSNPGIRRKQAPRVGGVIAPMVSTEQALVHS